MPKRGKGQPKKVTANRGYDPEPRDLEIYRELCKGRTVRDVAESFGLNAHSTVIEIRDKVRRYLAPKLQKEIIDIKVDQTESLNHIFQEMMAAWEKSKNPQVEEINTVADDGSSHTVKRKNIPGETAYIAQARGALADIRSIWNVEKHFDQEGQMALNPAGIKRDEYKLKVAQAQLSEAQELIAELQAQGVKIDG